MTNIFTIYLFHDKKIQIQVKILRKRGCCSLKHFPRATRPGRKMFRVRQRNAKIFIQGNDVRLLHGKQGQDVPQKYESNLQLWKQTLICSRKYEFWKFYKQLKLGKLLKMWAKSLKNS